LARPPGPHRHQGQKHFARELGAAPDKPRVPRAGFDLGGGKEFCYLLHYAEPRFGHRSLLSLVVDDNPMPPYHERETATPPMNSRCYAVSLMPMGRHGGLPLQREAEEIRLMFRICACGNFSA